MVGFPPRCLPTKTLLGEAVVRHSHLISVLICAVMPLGAQAQSGVKAPAKPPLVFAISEGSSGGINAEGVKVKYQALTDTMSRAIGREITIAFVREFSALERGMKEQQFDLLVARPSDYPARGLRDYKYAFVATAKPDGHCELLVHADSPLKSVADIKGKRLVMPEQKAYMSRFCNAELRDQGILLENENVTYVREQGAIPFAIDNTISHVGGVASYSGAYKQWKKAGKRVLLQSRAQPYMPLIASSSITPEQIAKLQVALTGLANTDEGKVILTQLAITDFVTTEELRLRKLLEWLGV